MSFEEGNKLGLEVLFLLMFGLVVNVINSSLHFADADRISSVAVLPLDSITVVSRGSR